MCIRDRLATGVTDRLAVTTVMVDPESIRNTILDSGTDAETVSYTHLRAHETVLDLVCRLLLAKKKTNNNEYGSS